MIEHNWQSTSRGGKRVVIYATGLEDHRGDYVPRTINGAIENRERMMPFSWTSAGRAFDGGIHPMDLVPRVGVVKPAGDAA